MEIKIDTKKDSVDDIKKIIRFLQNFIENNKTSNYSKEPEMPEVDEGAFNIFGDDSDSSTSSTLTNTDKDEDEDSSGIQIVEY